MDFDYGTVARHNANAEQEDLRSSVNEDMERERTNWFPGWGEGQTPDPPKDSIRARDLFSDGSCAWTEYYANYNILEKVGRLYSSDFGLFGWYDLDSWKQRLEECFNWRE